MTHQALARKWRPQNFHQLVGQQHVLQALTNALDSNRLHHAYLFTGTRGVGKTTIGRILAKCLNCEQGISSKPCGECGACVEIAQGRFVDLIEVDAASRTKVEDTRELLENVQYQPSRGRYKIYLIDEVHMLSTSSFNALLKTLEEPPEHVLFILATTDPQKIPPTVLSRCLQFYLKNMSPEQIQQHLQFVLTEESLAFEESALDLLARSADGSMRDALSLTDQAIAHGNGSVNYEHVRSMLGAVDKFQMSNLLNAIASGDSATVLAITSAMAEFSIDYKLVLEDLILALFSVAKLQVIPEAEIDYAIDKAALTNLAAEIDPETVQLYYQIALHGRDDMRLVPDKRVGFEMTLLRMLAFIPESEQKKNAKITEAKQTSDSIVGDHSPADKSEPEGISSLSSADSPEKNAVNNSKIAGQVENASVSAELQTEQHQVQALSTPQSEKEIDLENYDDLEKVGKEVQQESVENKSIEKQKLSNQESTEQVIPAEVLVETNREPDTKYPVKNTVETSLGGENTRSDAPSSEPVADPASQQLPENKARYNHIIQTQNESSQNSSVEGQASEKSETFRKSAQLIDGMTPEAASFFSTTADQIQLQPTTNNSKNQIINAAQIEAGIEEADIEEADIEEAGLEESEPLNDLGQESRNVIEQSFSSEQTYQQKPKEGAYSQSASQEGIQEDIQEGIEEANQQQQPEKKHVEYEKTENGRQSHSAYPQNKQRLYSEDSLSIPQADHDGLDLMSLLDDTSDSEYQQYYDNSNLYTEPNVEVNNTLDSQVSNKSDNGNLVVKTENVEDESEQILSSEPQVKTTTIDGKQQRIENQSTAFEKDSLNSQATDTQSSIDSSQNILSSEKADSSDKDHTRAVYESENNNLENGEKHASEEESNDQLNWLNLVENVELSGYFRQLAIHSCVVEVTEHEVVLWFDEQGRNFADDKNLAEFAQRIQSVIGQRKLKQTTQQPANETLAQREKRLYIEAKNKAIDKFQNDPAVCLLLKTFEADLDTDSIEPDSV